MDPASTLATAALAVVAKTFAIGVGGAIGAGIVLGGAKFIRWLKMRAT